MEQERSEEDINRIQTVTLVGNGHQYIFRYSTREDEKTIFEEMKRMKDDPDYNINLFDVSVLIHQMGQKKMFF